MTSAAGCGDAEATEPTQAKELPLLSVGYSRRDISPDEGVPLEAGGYDASILVQFYDESGNALSVNAKIDGVSVEVK